MGFFVFVLIIRELRRIHSARVYPPLLAGELISRDLLLKQEISLPHLEVGNPRPSWG